MRNLSMFMLFTMLLGTCLPASAATRVWIDTDPACGTGATNDADDCIALLYLLAHPGLDVVGMVPGVGEIQVGVVLHRTVGQGTHGMHEGPGVVPIHRDGDLGTGGGAGRTGDKQSANENQTFHGTPRQGVGEAAIR